VLIMVESGINHTFLFLSITVLLAHDGCNEDFGDLFSGLTMCESPERTC
jgi:hypothetical protein